MTPLFDWLFSTLDERLRVRGAARSAANKVFPHHWSFLLGEVALFSFLLLVATGIFLAMFYTPSIETVTYRGSLELYQGQQLPGAFESIVRLSHDVPGGIFFRRVHRGAAYLLVAGIAAHLLRVLLTGAFRRPREVNYVVGIGLMATALALAATGQSLPYDIVEGAALRIAYAMLLAIPFFGEQVGFWVFGGEFFGEAIPRFYVLHILILPGVFVGLLTLHLLLVVRQRHTQFPRPDVDAQRHVVGTPLWPSQFSTSVALALAIVAALAGFSVLAPWSDVTLHGPALAGHAANASHPDVWLLWLEGALTVYPPWEWYPLPGVVISSTFVAGVVLPVTLIGFLATYPFLDRRLHPVDGDVHVLQRPGEAPYRTGIVVAVSSLLVVLILAGLTDYVARAINTPVENVIVALRAGVLVVPALGGAIAVRVARRTGTPARDGPGPAHDRRQAGKGGVEATDHRRTGHVGTEQEHDGP